MKKTFSMLLIFVVTNFFGQTFSGALKLSVFEKVKNESGKLAVVNQSLTIFLNDTIRILSTTDADGSTQFIKNLSPGKYNVKVVRADCQSYEVRNIIIGEGKTAYVGILLTCTSYITSLTKKEKKKLGYK
jgi:hypothetical protein